MERNIGWLLRISLSTWEAPIVFKYSLDGFELTIVNSVVDLGIIWDDKLLLHSHIDNLVLYCIRVFNQIKYIFYGIKCVEGILTLYHSLMRSKIEYGSPAWMMLTRADKMKLDKIQSKIYNLLDDWNIVYQPPVSLEIRRIVIASQFVYNVFSNAVHCPVLFSNLGISLNLHSKRKGYELCF